jgi:F-type H+-transporting ATPase subunit b
MASLAVTPMADNFLVPNGTFFVELAAFALLFYLLAKYVIPPINRAMTNRQEAIRKEFADLDQAPDRGEPALAH